MLFILLYVLCGVVTFLVWCVVASRIPSDREHQELGYCGSMTLNDREQAMSRARWALIFWPFDVVLALGIVAVDGIIKLSVFMTETIERVFGKPR